MIVNEECVKFVNSFIEIYEGKDSSRDKMRKLMQYTRDYAERYFAFSKIFDCKLPLGVVAISRGRCK